MASTFVTRITRIHLINILSLLFMESAAQCFQYTRMPKVLQTTNPDADYDTSATAIAAHDASNAIFVGGHIIEDNFLVDLAVHGTDNIPKSCPR